MGKLMSLFRAGAGGGSSTEAIRQSTSMTMAYLLEQNRKFELFMREKVELLEGRVAAQSVRDEFEEGEQMDGAAPEGAADMPGGDAEPAAPTVYIPGEEDEPFQPPARAALKAQAVTGFEADPSNEIPAAAPAEAYSPDPQQDQAVDWQFLLGDEPAPPRRSESSSLVVIHDDESEQEPGEVEEGPIHPALPEIVVGEEIETEPEETAQEDLAEPEQDWTETEAEAADREPEETLEEVAEPEQDWITTEADDLEPEEMTKEDLPEPEQNWTETEEDDLVLEEEITKVGQTASGQDETWDGSETDEKAPEGSPVAGVETTIETKPTGTETNIFAPKATSEDVNWPVPAAVGEQQASPARAMPAARRVGTSTQKAAGQPGDPGEEADSMMPAWLRQF